MTVQTQAVAADYEEIAREAVALATRAIKRLALAHDGVRRAALI